MTVRTRFAPSPTGFLHIGGARTALFSWAYARRHAGTFILRIEDTDVARSTPEAVQAILDSMRWLGLDWDEGPFFQMQRMDRYRVVLADLLNRGLAYHCYTTTAELDALRDAQRQRGDKPRYDGRWRPAPGKPLPPIPHDQQPVVRFRNPVDGVVSWHDHVKGQISIANAELDDLIIARADGTPTYNFCVAVDDADMAITHVIRGDDHVNNTPRQINILAALGAALPEYAHVSMILGSDGQKLTKRHGAVSAKQFNDDGYLQPAVINYLARLGWSHGDDEIFSAEQLCAWFDLEHITSSAAQFDFAKLDWLNAHYLKQTPDVELVELLAPRLLALGARLNATDGPDIAALIALYKERSSTLNALVAALTPFVAHITVSAEHAAQHLTAPARLALDDLSRELQTCVWEQPALSDAIKRVLSRHAMKMPQLAIPLRVALLDTPQTPAIDAVLAAMGRPLVLQRLAAI